MNNRILFLDDMRVIACFMVIMVHACEFFYAFGIQSPSDAFWVDLIDGAFRCSVPLFVMISAYLLVPVRSSASEFLRKRLTRVVVPFAVWSVLYATLPYLWGAMTGDEVAASLRRLTYNFNDACGHLWYVYMFVGIYLFMPVISPWLEQAGKRAEQGFLLLWFLSTCFPYLRFFAGDGVYGECLWNEYHTLWYFSGHIGYVVLAHYIRVHLDWSDRKSLVLGSALFLGGYLVTSGVWYAQYDPASVEQNLANLELSWRFCTPNVAAMSFGAFIVIKKLFSARKRENSLIRKISAVSYGVYLMHIFILGGVYNLCAGHFSTPVTILIVGSSTFVLTTLLAALLARLPFGKYIVG